MKNNNEPKKTNIFRRITLDVAIICIGIFLIGIIFQFIGDKNKNQENNALYTQQQSVSSYQSDQNNSIKTAISGLMSANAKQYLASNKDPFTINYKDGKLSITVRVIFTDAIPCVAEELCKATIAYAEEHNIEIQNIMVQYYSESNAEGIDKESMVYWLSLDKGLSGIYTNNSTGESNTYTIEELYKKYNNFGKE